MAVALAAADTYVVVLALTDMMTGVGLGIDALQKATPIISGFLLGYIAVLPLIGRLSDLVSRQQVLLWCLAVFVLGSAVTALAVELPVLVAGRVVQGIGGGGLVPATLAIVADLWPPGRRGTPLGVVGAVQELGSVLGPVLGAAVLAVADWRAIFWLNVVLGVVLAGAVLLTGRHRPARPRGIPVAVGVLALAAGGLALAAPAALVTDVTLGVPFVPFAPDSGSRVATPIGVAALVLGAAWLAVTAPRWWPLLRRADLPGAALLGVALGTVVLTFAASDPEREVVGPLGLALLPVGAVAAALYLWRHRRAAEPLVARGVVRGRARPALAVSLLAGVALVAVVVDVPVLARLTLTDSQTTAAFVLVRFLVAVPVGALAGGWLLRRLGDGAVAGAGLLVAAGGLWRMSLWGDGSLEASQRHRRAGTGGCRHRPRAGTGQQRRPGQCPPRRPRRGQRAGGRGPHGRDGGRARAADRGRAAPLLRGGGGAARPDRHHGAGRGRAGAGADGLRRGSARRPARGGGLSRPGTAPRARVTPASR